MTHTTCRAALWLVAVLVSVVLLVRVIFAAEPSPTLEPFTDCESKVLCWMAIIPGQTTAPEATRLLQETGADVTSELFSYPTLGRIAEGQQIRARFLDYWVVIGADNDRVSIIESTKPMCIGSVLLLFGLPDEVRVERDRVFVRYEQDSRVMIFAGTFEELPTTRRFWLYDTTQYLSPPVQPSGDVLRWSQAEGYFRGTCG